MWNFLKAVLHRMFPFSREDRAIAALKAGDIQHFIDFFNSASDMRRINHMQHASATGRVIVEYDCYTYVRIDGVMIECVAQPLVQYEKRKSLIEMAEAAVLSNVYGTLAYDHRHFLPSADPGTSIESHADECLLLPESWMPSLNALSQDELNEIARRCFKGMPADAVSHFIEEVDKAGKRV